MQGERTYVEGLPEEKGIQGHSLSSSRAGKGNRVEGGGGKRVGRQGLNSPSVTKDFTGALSSSAGWSYAASLVTSNVLSTKNHTPAFNVSSMTSKPVLTESNCYTTLVKLSDSDSSADEAETSKAEQGAGPTVPAVSPHKQPEPRTQGLPMHEPTKGSASVGLAKQSTTPYKGKDSRK